MPFKKAILMREFQKNVDTVNAYIVYKNRESAEEALKYNGRVLYDRHIRVDSAIPLQKVI